MPRPAAAAVPATKPTPTATRPTRQKTLSDARRQHVLDAARTVFFEHGLEGTSIREIAKQAGYTPGAIYSYFASKEDVYAALLGESLERLNDAVQAALAPSSSSKAEARLDASASAFFRFYADNPRDLDLGFYLFQGMQPRGLTAELNERLNQRLRDSLAPVEAALQELGMDAANALAEVTALFAHAVGLLVLSHTGRIRMFRQQSSELFAAYLQQLAARAVRAAR
ncbi:TetR/AcrR family transcriptional regulator [Diaphorobacter caeni]|uniref:TetR/AcrR family transcriptional regulator n=1 Tax=Diaphorobacter caeni TaxID=2784387 RepID=UPI00188F0287|nr:TetR/AcrR family transcriptional regulator [Diaphorobacter caeni]MBF5004467.1 TetR/AcrR family transcriptional regulator [Diaphorobacter caeni]